MTADARRPRTPASVDIVPLTFVLAQRWVDALCAMDRGTIGERWEATHWLASRAAKWALSQAAVMRHGEVIGAAIASRPNDADVHIHRLVVSPDFRGKGIGEELVRAVARVGELARATRVTLKVSDQNTAARRFYERIGFRAIGRQPTNLLLAASCALLAANSDASLTNT